MYELVPEKTKKIEYLEGTPWRFQGYNYFSDNPAEMIEWLDAHHGGTGDMITNYLSNSIVEGGKAPVFGTPADEGLTYDDVEFQASDGVTPSRVARAGRHRQDHRAVPLRRASAVAPATRPRARGGRSCGRRTSRS